MSKFTANLLIIYALVWAAQAQTPEQPAPVKFPYEGSNSVIKYDCTFVNLQADGKNEAISHYRIAVLTERGIRENATDVMVYNLGYDTVMVISAKVHLPDGLVIELDSSAIKDVPLPAFGKFYLQNVREKIITFPQLVKGAEIEILAKSITREPPMDGQFDMSDGFDNSDPVQTKFTQIIAPENLNLTHKTRNGDIPYTKTTQDGKAIHTWYIQNIPQMVPEPGMPPVPEIERLLFVTTVKDWKTWSRWYAELSAPMMVANDEIKQEVKRLTEGKTREDKIKEIFYYVSNQIRYVDTALTGKKAGYKPEDVTTTMRNKYGVCRDKAALMVTMLREAGISADITLMNPAWKIDGDIPADQFNHAIVAVNEPDGKVTFVDPTVEKTKDFLAASEQDKAVLVCTTEGKDLEWTPIEPSEKNLYEIKANSKLEDNGHFNSEITISTRGLPDLILRNFLQSQPPKSREDLFKRFVQAFSPTAVLNTLIFTDFLDYSKQIEIKLSFSASDFSIPAGKYLLFQVPNQSSGLDFLTGSLLSGSELTQRRYDLQLESTFAVRAEETVTFPKGYKVRSLPEKVNLDYGDFRLARDFESGKQTLKVKRVLDMRTLRIALNKYDKLQEMMKAESTMGRGQVVLVKS